ncbi:hypothetical protein AKJ09_04447 [Labilithrix luteola]|uniref:Uncharacterized protein n=1 Tax=Labilithrix luteola TaxID=1391654 RepID=A0A0K1PW89_9BACT|nr:hypothetical protein [Labilithrix luteola]AKU97783.1 hypothetical protein AKJ09_04447 [Labilithrix luteola]
MSVGQVRGPSMGASKLHRSLVDYLYRLPDDVDRTALLACLQRWLAHFVGEFGKPIRLEYGLDKYVDLDLLRYPLSRTALEAAHALRCLRSHERPTLESLASAVSSAFRQGITVASEVDCPRCWGPDGLKFLESPTTNMLVLACDTCGRAQDTQGQEWSATEGKRLRAPEEARFAVWDRREIRPIA